MLAFIDYNTHLGGDQLTKLDGKPVFVARFGKRTKQWYATPALPLDETHLDGVRGLILPRGFRPVHQQVELVGAMRQHSTRTNRSAYAYAKELIQS